MAACRRGQVRAVTGAYPGSGSAGRGNGTLASMQARASRRRVGLLAVSWIAVLAVLTGGASLMTANGGDRSGVAAGPQTSDAPTAGAAPLLSVSLTFDGGRSSQREAARILADHQLRATFFVNSGFIGAADFLNQEDLHRLAEQHHEIGGYTVTLADLTAVEPGEAQRQVCSDRATLSEWGFKVTSFAYPFGASSPTAEEIVSGCGYNSARGQDRIRSPYSCESCAPAETVRPEDPFNTRATAEVGRDWTLQGLQQTVEQAEAAGGWLQLAFYDIDDSGSPLSITPALFEQFAAWLDARTAQGTMGVRTVHEVIGKVAKPVVPGADAPPAGPGRQRPAESRAGNTGKVRPAGMLAGGRLRREFVRIGNPGSRLPGRNVPATGRHGLQIRGREAPPGPGPGRLRTECHPRPRLLAPRLVPVQCADAIRCVLPQCHG